jgi:hypothetical protein
LDVADSRIENQKFNHMVRVWNCGIGGRSSAAYCMGSYPRGQKHLQRDKEAKVHVVLSRSPHYQVLETGNFRCRKNTLHFPLQNGPAIPFFRTTKPKDGWQAVTHWRMMIRPRNVVTGWVGGARGGSIFYVLICQTYHSAYLHYTGEISDINWSATAVIFRKTTVQMGIYTHRVV